MRRVENSPKVTSRIRGWRPPKRKRVAPRVLKDIVDRVVKAVKPDRIILFGSAARGTMGPNSDVDLLVIKGGKYNRARVTSLIYRSLFDADEAVDVIVVKPEEVEQFFDSPYFVIHPALREGRTVYGE